MQALVVYSGLLFRLLKLMSCDVDYSRVEMAKILVVEDSLETLGALKSLLQSERHTVDCVPSADEALAFIEMYQYEVLIVDWEMPGMTGIELIQKYRSIGGVAPVLMLTGKASTPDKISGLDCGADYYLTKPFDGAELLGFVRASLRRAPLGDAEVIKFADLELNPSAAQVVCGTLSLQLSAKELAVLQVLMANITRIVSHEELRGAGWPDEPSIPSGTVRVFLSALREKVQGIGAKVRILSVRGYGYRLTDTE